ncbi:MAG: MoaD/ThiS family protein [Acidimicrobiia bacterium]
MIRVQLPYHLRNLAGTGREVELEIESPVTLRTVLDELERTHPVLRGTIRDHETADRRPFVRFFACQEDFSHEDPDTELPAEVAAGKEPLMVIGAMSGG